MKTTFVAGFALISSLATGQNNKTIAKITYRSIPVTQYCIGKSQTVGTATKGSALELLNGYKTFYTLWLNLKTRSSIYEFDSLVTTKVRGREADNVNVADEVRYCIKPVGNTSYKSESIMNESFKTKGTVGDIDWEITDEKKQVLGFDCTKAVSKNKDLMMTVWFTSSVPVSSGPAIYFGLPGLVVWAEDFFRTTQIEKIEYSDNTVAFDAKMKKMESQYIANTTFIKEPVLIIRKAELGKYFYKLIQAEDQK